MTTATARARRRALGAAALAASLTAVSVLAGCSDDEGAGANSAPSSSDSPSEGASASTDTISPPDLPTPPQVRNSAGGVADVTYDECGTERGDQTLAGTVTNPTKRSLDYVITFNWINDTSDVLGRGFVVVQDVGGGKSADWSLEASVEDGATQCVPNVLRGTVSARG